MSSVYHCQPMDKRKAKQKSMNYLSMNESDIFNHERIHLAGNLWCSCISQLNMGEIQVIGFMKHKDVEWLWGELYELAN